MPPISIHKNDPITPAKPDGTTPSTPTSNPQNPPPTRTTPASVPATTTAAASSSNPPPPQPGARPAAPTGPTHSGAYMAAPPQPGATPTPTATVITTETRRAGPPAQFTQPPPTDSALAGRSTATITTPSKPGPTYLNYGPMASPFQSADTGGGVPDTSGGERRSLEHPPGYVQTPDNAPYTAGGGIGAQAGGSGGSGATAWELLNKAGEALKSGEEAVWRAVKGK
ncbi:hypothetical protein NX059_001419 [Plenodomus lindquistii]|nr:hypothetical protein NX059_001419 [Plenodomus lindquistii]